jgi:hypothetical protein
VERRPTCDVLWRRQRGSPSCDRPKPDFANGLSRLECCERTPCERPSGRHTALRRRPAKPALGRGRLQRQVRRATPAGASHSTSRIFRSRISPARRQRVHIYFLLSYAVQDRECITLPREKSLHGHVVRLRWHNYRVDFLNRILIFPISQWTVAGRNRRDHCLSGRRRL